MARDNLRRTKCGSTQAARGVVQFPPAAAGVIHRGRRSSCLIHAHVDQLLHGPQAGEGGGGDHLRDAPRLGEGHAHGRCWQVWLGEPVSSAKPSCWSCQSRSGTPASWVAMVGRPALKVSCRSGAAGHRPVAVMCPEPLEGLRAHERDLNLG